MLLFSWEKHIGVLRMSIPREPLRAAPAASLEPKLGWRVPALVSCHCPQGGQIFAPIPESTWGGSCGIAPWVLSAGSPERLLQQKMSHGAGACHQTLVYPAGESFAVSLPPWETSLEHTVPGRRNTKDFQAPN